MSALQFFLYFLRHKQNNPNEHWLTEIYLSIFCIECLAIDETLTSKNRFKEKWSLPIFAAKTSELKIKSRQRFWKIKIIKHFSACVQMRNCLFRYSVSRWVLAVACNSHSHIIFNLNVLQQYLAVCYWLSATMRSIYRPAHAFCVCIFILS